MWLNCDMSNIEINNTELEKILAEYKKELKILKKELSEIAKDYQGAIDEERIQELQEKLSKDGK